jgi:hypothetical protein
MFLIEGQLLAKKEVFGSKYGATSGQGLLKANTVGEGINKDREEGGKELEEARDLAHECSGLRRSHPRLGRCHLREMPLTVVVDREDRITISHAGDGDPLLFEDGINALLAE